MKILNIYGQPYEHSEAKIIGNREGLESLKQAIDDALTFGSGRATTSSQKEPLFASDGEGYEVIVESHNTQWGIDKDGKYDRTTFWNSEESHPEYTGYKG